MFAGQLAENAPMHAAIREAVSRGVPVYAECGGLMYLGQSLRDLEGVKYPMLGLIPAVSAMSNRRPNFGLSGVGVSHGQPCASQGPEGPGTRIPLVNVGAAARPRPIGLPGTGSAGPRRRIPGWQRLGQLRAHPSGKRPIIGPPVRRFLC